MKYLIPSYRVPAYSWLFWIPLIVAVAAALLFWMGNGAPAETSHAPDDAVTVQDLVKPDSLVTPSEDNPATAFREDQAGFSAHYRVPGSEGLPRLNVEEITEELQKKPDDSNANRQAGRHVDSGANFGIVELPMAVTQNVGFTVPPKPITVYYDDRGWVVAYLPADDHAVGIWKYDPMGQPTDDLKQNLLVLAINEVLLTAGRDVTDHGTVGYYHWKPQYQKLNAFVLFSHESSGGTSEPIRFVVPPTIKDIRASAAVLDTTPVTPAGAILEVDEKPAAMSGESSRMEVKGFPLARTSEATTLHKVTIDVADGATAAGAVMLLYIKPGY